MKETEVAEPIVEWLDADGWDVYQEVQYTMYGPIHDIVARKGNILWCVETKTSLSFAVIEQAYRAPFPFRSVGVPSAHSHERTFAKRILRDHGIGLFEVSWKRVSNYIPPSFIRNDYGYSKDHILPHLVESQKSYKPAGGTTGGHLTPYRETMDRVRKIIAAKPGCDLKYVFAELGKDHHYSSDNTAKSAIRHGLEHFEKDWCRINKSFRPQRYYVRRKYADRRLTDKTLTQSETGGSSSSGPRGN